MSKIHNVESSEEKSYAIDPEKGIVQKTNQVIGQGSASSIAHDGETYKIEADGSFEVPDELADLLCHTPGWFRGANPFQSAIEAEVAHAAPTPRKRTSKIAE
jgi:hypothetical protein